MHQNSLFRSLSKSIANGSFLGKSTLVGRQHYRFLSLHEYQSMKTMHQYGIKTPRFASASTADEAEQIAQQFKGDVVVKAQVLAGGRGLGYFKENGFQGGVHLCTSPSDVKTIADRMLGKTLVTKQTGIAGRPCHRVLIAERCYLRKERYFAILMDRSASSIGAMILASSIGGTNVEDIAAKNPNAILRVPVDLNSRPSQEQLTRIANCLFGELASSSSLKIPNRPTLEEVAQTILGLYNMFVEKDCILVEVNPFAETHDGRILVCDAKVNFDDNALFRQKDILVLKDETQMDPREVAAAHHNLNYVGLDGNIGCMVNGAGLAMATMDLIQLHGGEPANFLDVGGGADENQVMEALRILQNDTRVEAILVNIFGGIMRCDIIAQGLISASKKIGLTKPIIVRLEGTNKRQAEQLLNDQSAITGSFLFESDFNKAAHKAVKAANIIAMAKEASISVKIKP